MEIRRIQPEDINSVVEMWVEFMDDQHQYDDFFERSPEGEIRLKDRLHEYLRDVNYLLAGAFYGTELAGYVLAQISDHPPFFRRTQFCNLRHLYIKETYRNQQYGKALVEFTKEWSRQKGIHRIELLVAAKNKNAISFYYDQGFDDFCLLLAQEI